MRFLLALVLFFAAALATAGHDAPVGVNGHRVAFVGVRAAWFDYEHPGRR